MTLRDYLEKTGETHSQFAKRTGLSRQCITRYVSRGRIPEPEAMRTIANATRQMVTANDFYEIVPLEESA